MRSPGEPTVGPSLLLELRDRRSLEDVRRDVASFGPDRATATLRSATGDDLDLGVAAHRRALLAWLRSWGCRHLRVADTPRSAAALARWWTRWADALPPARSSITALDEDDLARVASAYGALASLRAAVRAAPDGDVVVTFGDTAAAKALYALRPRALPPWDEPIRHAFGGGRHDGPAYARYVAGCADALRGAGRRLGVEVDDLPALVGRPASSPARVVDEFLWVRITRGR